MFAIKKRTKIFRFMILMNNKMLTFIQRKGRDSIRLSMREHGLPVRVLLLIRYLNELV